MREPFGEQHVRAAWGVLAAIERDDTDLAGDISEMWDPLRLQEGLAIVAQCLMVTIREHAQDRDCNCGSIEWVAEMALRAPEEHREGDRAPGRAASQTSNEIVLSNEWNQARVKASLPGATE